MMTAMLRLRRDAEFWEIEQKGVTIEITTGLQGKPGATTVRTFLTAAQAAKQLDVLVEQKTAVGYAERAHAPDSPGGELEAAIANDPYDAAIFAVYADWLASCGDPRGELAALQIAAEQRLDDIALRDAAAALLAERESDLLGPVTAGLPKGYKKIFTWCAGFVHAVSLDFEHLNRGRPARYRGVGNPKLDLRTPLEQLLDHPAGRFLTEVTLASESGFWLAGCLPTLAAIWNATSSQGCAGATSRSSGSSPDHVRSVILPRRRASSRRSPCHAVIRDR
jgi:uncharacterized protein (TIGR02996 family)